MVAENAAVRGLVWVVLALLFFFVVNEGADFKAGVLYLIGGVMVLLFWRMR